MASSVRRPLLLNKAAATWRLPAEESAPTEAVARFHKTMPGYAPTPLVSLKDVASEVGVRDVRIKLESQRLGLPSFKILGASWATFRALAQELGLPLDTGLDALKVTLGKADTPTTIFAATDGNHGRAVARMGAMLGVTVRIYVPAGLSPSTIQLIRDEGATVDEIDDSYDYCVQLAFRNAGSTHGGILVQDTAFPGYEEIPTVYYP